MICVVSRVPSATYELFQQFSLAPIVAYEDIIGAMARHGTVRPTGRGILVDLSVVNAGAATYAGGDVDAHLTTVAEQMKEGYDPATDAKAEPVRHRTAVYKAIAAGVMIGAAIFGASGAYAVPIMDVTASQSIGEYDGGHPGVEALWQYTIANQSEPLQENYMVEFTLPAGSDDGLFFIDPPAGWTPIMPLQGSLWVAPRGCGDRVHVAAAG